jgi:hypothetical protein
MFDEAPIPDSKNLRILWIEFHEDIYVGEDGYVGSVKLAPDAEEGGGRPPCVRYWREDEHWGFIMRGGSAVLVPDHNVRYVYGRISDGAEVEADKSDESEGLPPDGPHTPQAPPAVDQNGFPVSVAQLAYAKLDAATGDAPQVAPKRRGRPPKVRPPEESEK